MAKNIEIRNSTAEFLIFMLEGKEEGIQVMYKDETIWATQKAMAQLFDVGVPAISKHLKNIFESGELVENSVISKMETTLSKILCKWKQDSVVSLFLYLDSVFKHKHKLIHNQAPVMNRLCPFLLNLHK